MDGREAQALEQHRTLELLRLDELQSGLWDRAVSGDVKAVNAVLRIIEQRSRLLGLDRPQIHVGWAWKCGGSGVLGVVEGNARQEQEG